MLPVKEYLDHFIKIWENSPDHIPSFQRVYSIDEKYKREQNYGYFQGKLKELQKSTKIQQLRKNPGESFFPFFKGFLETVFDYEEEHLAIILSDEFKDVSKDFFYKARDFGPELSPENIYQAMRNVWIMNGLQLMMDKPVKITPSVFAYSMIYPYSDNLLDDPGITDTKKKQFSDRFKRRLYGIETEPESYEESQLFKLVSMIEIEFPRHRYPELYYSLYAIQHGQTNSLELIGQNGISDKEVQEICFEKGGASVLADGYLVAGKLGRQQEQALFGYGVYLQLLDDIQDIVEDSKAFTKTMFSCLQGKDMGKFVNRTIHFGRTVLEEMHCFKGVKNNDFLNLMNRSIETMIIESAGQNDKRYTKHYLNQLETFSPLHFSFLREKRSKSRSQRLVLFQKYFEQARSGDPVFSQ
jgi:hypothetical protein